MSSYSIKRKKELARGIKVESEHKHTYEKLQKYSHKEGHCPSKHKFYESIASDHLREFPKGNYYKELDKMEKKLKKENKK